MVKRFLYMLALAFALQMSAGVASVYCMHETGTASEHFGHHQHEHHSAEGDGDEAEDGSTSAKKASIMSASFSVSRKPTPPAVSAAK